MTKRKEFPDPMEGLILKVIYLAKQENLSPENTAKLIKSVLQGSYEMISYDTIIKTYEFALNGKVPRGNSPGLNQN